MSEDKNNENLNNQSEDEKSDDGQSQDKEQETKNVPYSRFKEVNDELSELRNWKQERESKRQEREEAELEEKEKYAELAQKRKAELENTQSEITQLKQRNAIIKAAYAQGAQDADDVWGLVDKSKLEIDDDGAIANADEVVEKLLEIKPYLKGDSSAASSVGAGSNQSDESGKTYSRTWVRERWADLKWVNRTHDDLGGLTGEEFLEKIEKEGRIDHNA